MEKNLGIFHDLLAILSKIASMSLAIFGTSGGMSPHRKSLTSTALLPTPQSNGTLQLSWDTTDTHEPRPTNPKNQINSFFLTLILYGVSRKIRLKFGLLVRVSLETEIIKTQCKFVFMGTKVSPKAL